MLKDQLRLSEEDAELLDEILEQSITIEEEVLDTVIDQDQTPDTIEGFMEVVSTQQERIALLRQMRERLGGQ